MSVELVRQVKKELEDKGVDLSGPCGSFEIVKRVAWRLRDQGYGLLGGKNPAQNGCTVNGERYSVDWILKATGMGRDILRDAGGANEPHWGHEELADPALYRPAIDPGDVPAPGPIEPNPGTPPPYDPAPLIARIVALESRVSALENPPQPVVPYHTHTLGFWNTSGPKA